MAGSVSNRNRLFSLESGIMPVNWVSSVLKCRVRELGELVEILIAVPEKK
jgi:hypothetical protein